MVNSQFLKGAWPHLHIPWEKCLPFSHDYIGLRYQDTSLLCSPFFSRPHLPAMECSWLRTLTGSSLLGRSSWSPSHPFPLLCSLIPLKLVPLCLALFYFRRESFVLLSIYHVPCVSTCSWSSHNKPWKRELDYRHIFFFQARKWPRSHWQGHVCTGKISMVLLQINGALLSSQALFAFLMRLQVPRGKPSKHFGFLCLNLRAETSRGLGGRRRESLWFPTRCPPNKECLFCAWKTVRS